MKTKEMHCTNCGQAFVVRRESGELALMMQNHGLSFAVFCSDECKLEWFLSKLTPEQRGKIEKEMDVEL